MGNLSKIFGLDRPGYVTATRRAPSLRRKQCGRLTRPLLVLLVVCVFGPLAEAKYGGGSGTQQDPYLICTAEQLNTIGANQSDWNKHFKLTADIDLSGYTGTDFNMIGYYVAWYSNDNIPFTGVFDGNNHTISNFSYTSADKNGIGLFSYVSMPSQVKNLGLINPNIFAQGGYVGSLVGYINKGIITDCYAKGASISGSSNVGGLVGSNDGLIVDCYSSGSVSGNMYVGGLAGEVGPGTVGRCYSTASVSGNSNVGGLIGKASDETSEIKDSYATATVTGGTYAGGLVGQLERGAVYKCYSAGSVSGSLNVGGLVGYTRALGIVVNSFWDTQASGQSASAGGTGKTTAQMQTENTYASVGWDFYSIWDVCEGANYPVLLWQIPVGDFRCPDGVNFVDYAWFAAHWRQNNCSAANYYCLVTDLDLSGSVGFSDLVIFADNWLAGL
ncbi:MAG: hypothetical protein KAY65_17360 [Planctomycetes bacterium]|nr:hypothetical protein [Planctomycetota bacterium]